jgi:hypothetical protein
MKRDWFATSALEDMIEGEGIQKDYNVFLQYIILGDWEVSYFMPGFAIINELVLYLIVVPLHRACCSEDEGAEVSRHLV